MELNFETPTSKTKLTQLNMIHNESLSSSFKTTNVCLLLEILNLDSFDNKDPNNNHDGDIDDLEISSISTYNELSDFEDNDDNIGFFNKHPKNKYNKREDKGEIIETDNEEDEDEDISSIHPPIFYKRKRFHESNSNSFHSSNKKVRFF